MSELVTESGFLFWVADKTFLLCLHMTERRSLFFFIVLFPFPALF